MGLTFGLYTHKNTHRNICRYIMLVLSIFDPVTILIIEKLEPTSLTIDYERQNCSRSEKTTNVASEISKSKTARLSFRGTDERVVDEITRKLLFV